MPCSGGLTCKDTSEQEVASASAQEVLGPHCGAKSTGRVAAGRSCGARDTSKGPPHHLPLR
ncbi:hypothetical protein [Paenibacillus silvae]|uniref:Uncharacterized protein n=1 Tax=Paenibacillus silvae TaxID=1325358 RepID=A0A2W6NB27_9BACL|nr:hypothetical protein [Paenibacillus silvae]PZT52951.1 hypothetical protein DN757_24805 [Paenibacillus silvae]